MRRNRDDENRRRAAAALIAQKRREMCRDSILKFGRAYLPVCFAAPPSIFHQEFATVLERASVKRGERIAVAAPRGHAKSTVASLGYVLWSVCYNREPYIVLISDTAGQAEDLLSHIKRELESNSRLLADFPEVCEPPLSNPGPPRWRQDEIITRNGIKITVLGAGQKIRGRRHNEHRPSLIILDDIENEEAVRSADQRDNLRDWFTRAALKAGDRRTNIVVVGTILHYGSLLAGLVDSRRSPGWWGRKYQAVLSWPTNPELWEYWEEVYNGLETDDHGASGPDAARAAFEVMEEDMLNGTQVLWPEGEDFYSLMQMRIRDGRAAFDSEKQNEPTNPEDCCFQDSDFVFWDDDRTTEDQLLERLRGHCRIIVACDPSLGKAGRGHDDSAIITVAKDTKAGTLYVLQADIRRRSPEDLIKALLACLARWKSPVFGIEANQFQEFLASEFRRQGDARGLYPRITKITQTSDKLGRIQSLQPLMAQGTLRFSRRHQILLDQLRQFPKADHDDGPDALEMAVKLARGSGGSRNRVGPPWVPVIGMPTGPSWPPPGWIPYTGPIPGYPKD